MKSLVLVALVGTAGLAGASERYPLYPDHHVAEEDALHRADAVIAACHYSEMSRIGPTEREVARCNAAEGKLIALGARAVPAVLERLDGDRLFGGALPHLYDVLARIGTPSLVEPLVAALEREDQAGLGNVRQWERGLIVSALERITHVQLKGTPAIEWRQWADAHRVRPTQTADVYGEPAS